MRQIIGLLFITCVCGLAFDASAAVLITSDQTYAEANNGSTFVPDNHLNEGSTTATATLGGNSSDTTSLFGSGGASGTFTQSRAGNYQAAAFGSVSMGFTTLVDTHYAASGNYSSDDGYAQLYAHLYDFTTSSYVFTSDQQYLSGPIAFTLGGSVGVYFNDGSLSGILPAGHSFQWYSQTITQARPLADGGATASGVTSLKLAGVPEQGSLIVWSLLAVTIGGTYWLRQLKLVAFGTSV